MNPTGKVASLVYALVLLACAFFAGFDTFAFGFAIGDGGGQVGVAAGALLIGTLVGGAGLAIASLGSWTRWRAVSLIALASALVVLPAAVLYGWQSASAFWVNTHLGMHYEPWAWVSAILPPFLGLTAMVLSWVRFRRLTAQSREAPLTR
jgi:hypothetical protein